MDVPGVDGLIEDIKMSIWIPAVTFILFSLAERLTPHARENTVTRKLPLIFVILLFAIGFSTLMFQDRAVLLALWEESPILYSLVYPIAGALIIAGIGALAYWKLRPELWRRKDLEPSEEDAPEADGAESRKDEEHAEHE
jgi:hypothetical protein